MDTFKLNKGGVLKFDAFVISQTVIHYGYPIWIKNYFYCYLFPDSYSFSWQNIHLWYILLYQTSGNLQIIHVHVSHFVIYEKNILITLRFVAKKKKKNHIILANQPSCYFIQVKKSIFALFH